MALVGGCWLLMSILHGLSRMFEHIKKLSQKNKHSFNSEAVFGLFNHSFRAFI